MPSFDDLDGMAGRAVDRVVGEAFTASPRSAPSLDVNARSVPDTARPVTAFRAGVYEFFSRADKQTNGSPRSQSALTAANLAEAAGHTTARIRIKFQGSALPFRLAPGDTVTRLKTGKVYRVAEVRISSQSNFTADLNLFDPPQ